MNRGFLSDLGRALKAIAGLRNVLLLQAGKLPSPSIFLNSLRALTAYLRAVSKETGRGNLSRTSRSLSQIAVRVVVAVLSPCETNARFQSGADYFLPFLKTRDQQLCVQFPNAGGELR